MDLMFRELIRESKRRPDLTKSDKHSVWLRLDCEVRDVRFLRFLERVGAEKQESFDCRDFLVLDCLHRSEVVPAELKDRLLRLRELGVVELIGKKYILSQEMYGFLGERATYTRKKGLDKDQNRLLLLRHLEQCPEEGCPLDELGQVLSALSKRQVQHLLTGMKREGVIHCRGSTKAGRWFAGPAPGPD